MLKLLKKGPYFCVYNCSNFLKNDLKSKRFLKMACLKLDFQKLQIAWLKIPLIFGVPSDGPMVHLKKLFSFKIIYLKQISEHCGSCIFIPITSVCCPNAFLGSQVMVQWSISRPKRLPTKYQTDQSKGWISSLAFRKLPFAQTRVDLFQLYKF